MKKTIVVSAVNFFEAGPLAILKECLQYLSDNLSGEYSIIALVHDESLLEVDGINYIEFKKSRKNWLFRIYYEYIYFYFLSRRIQPYLWFSLHDISPNVSADIRAVYCHNPSPFYQFSFRSLCLSYQIALFSLFYEYLYRINLKKNNFVVVQQQWMREKFRKMYKIRNVVVAYPESIPPLLPSCRGNSRQRFTFFYPAFPRVFKNFEVVAEAANLLCAQGGYDFEILFTFKGYENKYARYTVDTYKNIPALSFIGLQSKKDVYELYSEVDALLFPSKLETWGLPVSEFKAFNKPLLLADLPYAHETVGDFDRVKFFDPDNPRQLAEQMEALMQGTLEFDGNRAVKVEEPFARNWHQLFSIILKSKR